MWRTENAAVRILDNSGPEDLRVSAIPIFGHGRADTEETICVVTVAGSPMRNVNVILFLLRDLPTAVKDGSCERFRRNDVKQEDNFT
jgi:hypothetical protein